MKIWHGVIPDCFGYGIECLGETKDQVNKVLTKDWEKGKKNRGFEDEFSDMSMTEGMEHFGGRIEQIEVGKAYSEGFN